MLTGATLQSGATGTGNVSINGGTLTGTGAINGNLLGAGDVQPSSAGTTTGPMTVSGTYNDSSGTLTIPVSGTTNPGTDFGQLSATGAATLGGTLTLNTASGFSPPLNTSYTILKAGSVSGTFGAVNGRVLSDRQYVLTYNPTSVVAKVEPLTATVTGVSPNAGPLGTKSVTITGTNFVNNPAVAFGPFAATNVNVISPTQLTATAPAVSSPQTVDVTVNNGSGASPTSPADQYAYGAPTLSKVAPDASGLSGAAVTITGTGFVPGATVKFGSVAGTSVSVTSATTITATAPAATSAQTVDVTVTTPAGTSATASTTSSPTARRRSPRSRLMRAVCPVGP